MKPERPTTLTIGPLTWTVDYDHNAIEQADKIDRTERAGLTITGELLIRIDGEMPESLVRETLHHELLHATYYTHGIRPKKSEERTIAQLSPVLLDTMRRNPTLVAYLTA